LNKEEGRRRMSRSGCAIVLNICNVLVGLLIGVGGGLKCASAIGADINTGFQLFIVGIFLM